MIRRTLSARECRDDQIKQKSDELVEGHEGVRAAIHAIVSTENFAVRLGP